MTERCDCLDIRGSSFHRSSTHAYYPSAPGIQTIIDHLAKTRPEARGLKPQDFIDGSILKEIEDSGFVKKLYAN
jgi:hypothetical protein